MDTIHFVDLFPLPRGRWFTACGMRNSFVNYENITAERGAVTCLHCRGTHAFGLPLGTEG